MAPADGAVHRRACAPQATLEQAEARIHRMGQLASHVHVYYLLGGEGDGSLDEVMFGALVRKSRAAARAVDGGELPHDLAAMLAELEADEAAAAVAGRRTLEEERAMMQQVSVCSCRVLCALWTWLAVCVVRVCVAAHRLRWRARCGRMRHCMASTRRAPASMAGRVRWHGASSAS